MAGGVGVGVGGGWGGVKRCWVKNEVTKHPAVA